MLTTEKNYSEKDYTKWFIVYSYGLFCIMLVIFAGIFVLTGQNPWIMKYGSWDVLFYSIIALGFVLWYKIRISRKQVSTYILS